MAEPCPELVFLSGPQAGEHAVVLGQQALMGRSSQADIPLREEAASREQLVFELTPEGWVMENRSANGTEVNGKRYKRKQILLETGDILGVGQETRILYVSPEDDPKEAMAERGLQPVKPAPPPPQTPEQGPKPPPMDSPEAVAASDQADGASEADARKKAKMRKYLIFGGLYLAVIVALILYFATRGGEETDRGGVPDILSRTEIKEVIEGPLDISVQVDEIKAKEALEKARSHYRNRERTGNLAWAVKYFKLHQEYKGSVAFARSQDSTMFFNATREMVDRVYSAYRKAYIKTKRKRWKDAAEDFQHVREMITPLTSQPFPDSDNKLWKNVLTHLRYANRQIAAEKSR
ncbi:MAG: FHA domain-containing protein [Planctomycetota bacterium]